MVFSNLRNATCIKIAKSIFCLLFVLVGVPSHAQQKGKSPAVDTFKQADKLLSKHKIRKASRLYSAYHRNHPKDLNSLWKLAQTKLWLGLFHKSDTLYSHAVRQNPGNDYLRLNYIHSLEDMGQLTRAEKMLSDMEYAGKDYSDMALLRGRLSFYQGDYREAAAYLRKSLSMEANSAEAKELNDQVAIARAPSVSLNVAYLTDNQPLDVLISTLKFEDYFSRYAIVYLIADDYHFMQNGVSDAPWVRVGDKLFFPKAGLHINIGAGIMNFPVKHETGWSGILAFNQRISGHFDLDLSVDHVPYLDTKTSVDTNISATRESVALNWHLRNWSAQAAFMNSTFPDGNSVSGVYGWGLAPIAQFTGCNFLAGYSISYSNSTVNSYTSERTLSEILANYTLNRNVSGIYKPYFTPNDLFTNSLLLQLNLNPSKNVSINLAGDIGYGTINNPYLFLNNDKAGNPFIDKGYSVQSFTPANASATFNFRIARTWNLGLKYAYHNTYFFSSHYVSVGLQKSFLSGRRRETDGSTSTFSRLVKDVEGKIQGLYSVSSQPELKKEVGKIRSQLVTLRDAQQKRKNMSETLPDSDEAQTLQERYDNLNDMISDLDAVNLDDYNGSGKSKKQWLVDKLYDLTSISYNGSRD